MPTITKVPRPPYHQAVANAKQTLATTRTRGMDQQDLLDLANGRINQAEYEESTPEEKTVICLLPHKHA